MNRSPVRFRQEAPQKSGPHQGKHPVGVLFIWIEVALGYTFGYTSRKVPATNLFIFDPRNREQFRRRERLAACFKHRRRDPQLFRKLCWVTRPPRGLHERLERHEARRRYPIHLALAGGATGPPLPSFEMHELMRESATPLHLKQAFIQPNQVAAVRLATPAVKARELHTHTRERGVQMIPRVIKTHPPTIAEG